MHTVWLLVLITAVCHAATEICTDLMSDPRASGPSGCAPETATGVWLPPISWCPCAHQTRRPESFALLYPSPEDPFAGPVRRLNNNSNDDEFIGIKMVRTADLNVMHHEPFGLFPFAVLALADNSLFATLLQQVTPEVPSGFAKPSWGQSIDQMQIFTPKNMSNLVIAAGQNPSVCVGGGYVSIVALTAVEIQVYFTPVQCRLTPPAPHLQLANYIFLTSPINSTNFAILWQSTVVTEPPLLSFYHLVYSDSGLGVCSNATAPILSWKLIDFISPVHQQQSQRLWLSSVNQESRVVLFVSSLSSVLSYQLSTNNTMSANQVAAVVSVNGYEHIRYTDGTNITAIDIFTGLTSNETDQFNNDGIWVATGTKDHIDFWLLQDLLASSHASDSNDTIPVAEDLRCQQPNYWKQTSASECVLHRHSQQTTTAAVSHIVAKMSEPSVPVFVSTKVEERLWKSVDTWKTKPTLSVFVTVDDVVLVFGAQPNDTTPVEINRFNSQGRIIDLSVSNNARHVWTCHTRRQYEIDSGVRLAQICLALQNKSNEDAQKMFGKWAPACAQMAASLDRSYLGQFSSYLSMCPASVLCMWLDFPYFYASFPAGFVTTGGFTQQCGKGYFCCNGIRSICPKGFYCPESTGTKPIPCTDRGTDCSEEGLGTPRVCPGGFVCPVPYLPPTPAPPGTTTQPGASSKHQLLNCSLGDWCPLGSPPDHNQTLCPAGTYCPSPDKLAPTRCSYNVNQKNSSYCPGGQWFDAPCPAGSFCQGPLSIKPCMHSRFCPEWSMFPSVCPAGWYCPTPNTSIICPAGSYCREGSLHPLRCHFSFLCPPGTVSNPSSMAVIIGSLNFLPIVLLLALLTFFETESNAVWQRLCGAVARLFNRVFLRNTKSPTTTAESTALLKAQQRDIEMPSVSMMAQGSKEPLDIEFTNLSLRIKSKQILAGVTGSLKHGRVLAIMGPSGSGKTSFLNVLLGKAQAYGHVAGEILVNGHHTSLHKLKQVIGFVPQEDVMIRNMTVEENLRNSALLRLPSTFSTSQVEDVVQSVINMLGLQHIKHSQIGDETKRGISGGQRKRVNIGMELVALPSILFLDEPTSGLDAATSKDICLSIKKIALENSITVAMVIHQPRIEIFHECLDDVLLMGVGGRTAYIGPSCDMVGYFADSLGLKCPDLTNPVDFFLDVTTKDSAALIDQWSQRQPTIKPAADPSTSLNSPSESPQPPSSSNETSSKSERKGPGLVRQFGVFVRRALVQQYRDIGLITFLALTIMASLFIGIIFRNYVYTPSIPEVCDSITVSELKTACLLPIGREQLLGVSFMSTVALALFSGMSALKVFGPERTVFWRESSTGTSTPLYFLGKWIAQVPANTLLPLVFMGIVYTMGASPASFWAMYGVALAVQFIALGSGIIVSIVAPPEVSQLGVITYMVINLMFSGGDPTLSAFSQMEPAGLISLIPFFSFMRYALESLYLINIMPYRATFTDFVANIDFGMKLMFKYEISDLALCIVVLVAWAILVNVVAFFVLLFWNRSKRI